jgi:hypothetical protein
MHKFKFQTLKAKQDISLGKKPYIPSLSWDQIQCFVRNEGGNCVKFVDLRERAEVVYPIDVELPPVAESVYNRVLESYSASEDMLVKIINGCKKVVKKRLGNHQVLLFLFRLTVCFRVGRTLCCRPFIKFCCCAT